MRSLLLKKSTIWFLLLSSILFSAKQSYASPASILGREIAIQEPEDSGKPNYNNIQAIELTNEEKEINWTQVDMPQAIEIPIADEVYLKIIKVNF